ncbi:DNA polymerase III subunit delta' [Mycoplasma tauri]|uniref:DNA polymerase III subunit delta' n=1 Tax=Mycoplasma tauri TaxID=547987 RepID=UPI001CBD67EF|nr:DNA polymerase III subunit delta' [Mycoplasma tauri]MBZ4203365.1 DNA polymerase III subunit delta' [Mycoplasma tauri]
MVSKNLVRIIENSIASNKLAQCYLISSNLGSNIHESILFFINSINKTKIESLDIEHLPNNILYFDDELSKDKIVSILNYSSLSSFDENTYKIIVLKNIEFASNATVNALLKCIEEPSKNTIFLLTTNNKNRVLSTILSRSIVINIKTLLSSEIEDELLKENYSSDEALFYSNIFTDAEHVKKIVSNNSFSLIEDLLQAVYLSFKNKYNLYVYLSKFAKKDKKNTLFLLVSCLKFIFSWSWEQYSFKNILMKKVSKKLKDIKIDFFACFKALNEYLSNFDSNNNYFLQTERMLVKLMESYE